MSNMQLGPSGSYVNIYPTYDYTFTKTLDRTDLRTKVGTLYTYIGASKFTKFTIPLTWINSADRSLVNSWWENGTNLRLIEDSANPSSYYNVRITGAEEPFTKFAEPYFQTYFLGQIVLETT